MFAFYNAIREFKTALTQGDWEKAADVGYTILGWLLGKQPLPLLGGDTPTRDQFAAEFAEIDRLVASPPAAGGVGWLIFLETVRALAPLIRKLIEERIDRDAAPQT